MLRQEVRERRNNDIKSNHRKPFIESLVGRAHPVRSNPPPEASVASRASNPHGEAYTASPKALLLSLEITITVRASTLILLGATSTFAMD
jgi:hypothetical protein